MHERARADSLHGDARPLTRRTSTLALEPHEQIHDCRVDRVCNLRDKFYRNRLALIPL